MYGYVFAIIVGAVFLWLVIGQLSRSRPPKRTESPVGPEGPAADEPTPGRSVIEPERRKQAADRHTPPG